MSVTPSIWPFFMHRRHIVRPYLILLLSAVIAACSLKTLYNRLDYLIPEYVEGIVTLDDVLQQELEQSTASLLDWHRNTQLVQYARWLQAIQDSVVAGATEEQLAQRIHEMDEFWFALADRLNREMAHLLPQLDEAQRKELFASIHIKNEAFRKEYIELNEEARRQYYRERLLETFESWIGDLSQEQRNLIATVADKQVDTAELRLQRRLEWQQGIESILSDNISKQQKSLRLQEFMSGFVQTRSPELEEKSAYNQRLFIQLAVGVSHSMTETQVEHFVEKTGQYIKMLTELAENR